MQKETREFTIPIRVTFSEKERIKSRAKKTDNNISDFIRNSALRLCNKRETRQ